MILNEELKENALLIKLEAKIMKNACFLFFTHNVKVIYIDRLRLVVYEGR